MFLTRKSLKKVRVLTAVYCVLGALCLVGALVFVYLDIEARFLAVMGAIALILGVVFNKFGKYAEGKGKLINIGNKLVYHELRPAEFVRLYEEKRDCSDNVVSELDFNVLCLLIAAYDSMGKTDSTFEVLDQMLSTFGGSRKLHAKLLKSSVLFSMGRIDEAEQLYSEVLNGEMDMITKSVLEDVTKTDRAIALGDFTIAEAYLKARLEKPRYGRFPLIVLYTSMALGRIYCKTNRLEEAKKHLQYCVENGGETNVKEEAANMMREYNLI